MGRIAPLLPEIMEPVREIIRHQLATDRTPVTPMPADASEAAQLLQAVREYDALVYRGTPADLASWPMVKPVRSMPGLYRALPTEASAIPDRQPL